MPRRGRSKAFALIVALSVLLGMTAVSTKAQIPNAADKKYQSWLAARPYISDIIIEGNSSISDSKIKSRLFSRRNSFWQSLKTGSRNRVLRYTAYRDTLAIKYLYLTKGFLNVKIKETIAVSETDSSAIVNINIDEGSRYLIGRVILTANDSLAFYDELRRTVSELKIGDPVDPIKTSTTVFDLKTIFANNGYPYAEVKQTPDTATGAANVLITFKTREGPLVRFGRLNIKDLSNYHPSLVRREITFKEGELYSRERIIESQKRLYSTNLFNSINLDIDRDNINGSDPGTRDTLPDFMFSAIERKPHFISLRTGAGQDPQQDLVWDFSTAWGKRNIFRSRRAELSVQSRYIIFTQWRPLSHRFQIRYIEPWFINLRMPLTLTARFEPGVRSQLLPYRVQRWSVSLSTRKEWSERLYAVISGEYENVNIYGIEGEEKEAIQDTIRVRRKLTVLLVRDTRIDKFIPRSGSFTTYLMQYVGGLLGGNDSFIKLEYSWARYQTAIGRAVYATRIKAGWVKEFGDAHSVPADDRFYLGGANSIRGFRENTIGPRDADDINVGANAYAVFNQEIRFPIYWRFWGSVFTDMGNGWESFSEVNFDSILFSYGIGIQFLSPAGPIRLDYAHRMENGIYKEDSRFHITILYAF
jgi:outer membrane protein insertion porin family